MCLSLQAVRPDRAEHPLPQRRIPKRYCFQPRRCDALVPEARQEHGYLPGGCESQAKRCDNLPHPHRCPWGYPLGYCGKIPGKWFPVSGNQGSQWFNIQRHLQRDEIEDSQLNTAPFRKFFFRKGAFFVKTGHSCPVVREEHIQNGGFFYDRSAKRSDSNHAEAGAQLCQNRAGSWNFRQHSALILPPQPAGGIGETHHSLSALWKTRQNHSQAETQKVLLGPLPNSLVE